MMVAEIMKPLSSRPVMIAGALLAGIAIALVLGRWLAVVQAPLTRHAVAKTLLDDGAPEKAAHVFEAPIWQGVALYRAGRYHRAVGAFVTDDSVTGLYNMGNAYTRLGLYGGAVAAYEAVLQRQPNHEDARYNLELVRAAADRERELENEARQTENAGSWEDGLRDDHEQGEPDAANTEQPGEGEEPTSSDMPEEQAEDQDAQAGAGETAAPESQIAGENAGGSEKEGEQAEASVFSLSGRDDENTDDLSPEGGNTEDAEVVGGEIDRAREEAMADEILLRRIKDDPALVLKARLNMALRKQRAGR